MIRTMTAETAPWHVQGRTVTGKKTALQTREDKREADEMSRNMIADPHMEGVSVFRCRGRGCECGTLGR